MPDTWADGICVRSRAAARRDGIVLAPTHLVTLLDPGQSPANLGLDPARRIHLTVMDTHDRQAAHAPSADTVARLLAFVAEMPVSGRLLIHCLSGQSRSPAAALGVLAQRLEPLAAVAALRRICPDASPNRLIVSLCDDALGLSGQLTKAIAAFPAPRWQNQQ